MLHFTHLYLLSGEFSVKVCFVTSLSYEKFLLFNSVWFVASWKPLIEFLICFWFSDKQADIIVPGKWRGKIIFANVVL